VSAEKVILLLGRRDEPTDGVADYCEKLREAGLSQGLSFESVALPWAESGWRVALAELRKAAAGWRGRWVLLQYTTLAWSRHGFPLRAPQVLEVLRRSGARPGLVFHDFAPLSGTGIVGNAREYCQLRVLRRLFARSDLGIFTVPMNQTSWLPAHRDKAIFIPVGPNCPEAIPANLEVSSNAKTVAVYSITGGNRTLAEVADIDAALRRASEAVGTVRLLLFGRGSQEAEPLLQSALAGANVTIESLGLLTPEQISQTLSRADVLLFVRGHISTRRGSAIAGIACGLPVVCYSGPETSWPITEAGLVSVPLGNRQALAGALANVLSDATFRRTLAERSRQAQKKYFSWAAIAAQFAYALGAAPAGAQPDAAGKIPDAMRVA
jgi:glycosyltransferase involved in cell wall biosynthesis